jgi:hypothetical protein
MNFTKIKLEGDYAIKRPEAGSDPHRLKVEGKRQTIEGTTPSDSHREVRGRLFGPDGIAPASLDAAGFAAPGSSQWIDADLIVGSWEETQEQLAQQKARDEERARDEKETSDAADRCEAACGLLGIELYDHRWRHDVQVRGAKNLSALADVLEWAATSGRAKFAGSDG